MFKFMLIFMFLFIIIGCENNEIMTDEALATTIHFAIDDSFNDDNWKDFITITVNSNNLIVDVELNSVIQLANASRREIAQLNNYEEAFGYNFYEQATKIENSFVGIPSDELAHAILDAYHNDIVDFDTTTFARLANLALASEPVERGMYIDGTYRSIGNVDEDGFQKFVNLFVINGNIIAVHFNGINSEGFLKYDQFIATTIDHEIIEWRNQAQILEQTLVELQDPMAFTFNEDGLTTEIPYLNVEIESFVSLVTNALAAGPVTLEIEE